MIQELINNTNEKLKEFHNNTYKKGSNFNIYSLLGIEHNENNTHSVLLADLLNPRGSHGQNYFFLKNFIKTINNSEEEIKYAEIFREYYIGSINEDYTEGGRIDLLIKWNDHIWVIENKLYAKEQPNQIERYKQKFPNAKTFYLKVEEHLRYSNTEIVDYEISYEKEISDWLSSCIMQLDDKPYLQNSIKQYYNLVKNIAKTGEEHQMENSIKEIIGNNYESLLAAQKITDLFVSTLSDLENKLIEKLSQILSNNGYEYKNQVYFKSEWKELNIGVSFEFDSNKRFYFGIHPIEKDSEIDTDLVTFLQNIPGIEKGETWKIWKYFKSTTKEEYYNFLTSDQSLQEFHQEITILKDYINQYISKSIKEHAK